MPLGFGAAAIAFLSLLLWAGAPDTPAIRFIDIAAQSGLTVPNTFGGKEKNDFILESTGTGAAIFDYNGDGANDIFIANGTVFTPAGPPAHSQLYRNDGKGHFTDVSQQAGLTRTGCAQAACVGDFDNDGWPDIYVACDQTPSLLYRNKHDGTFEERGDAAGVAYNADGHLQAGMGIAVADYDGNGFLDIAKTNFSGDRPSLFRNEDGRFFEDVSEQSGLGRNQLLGWGVAFLDVDEDGWPDLVMANGHVYPEIDRSPIGETYRQKTLLYRHLGNGHFSDITASAGPGFAPSRPSRGLATGDLDDDGSPEILIVNLNDRPTLLKTLAPRQNPIPITLTGTRSNRSAIGARCTVEANGRKQIADVVSGGCYYSQSAFTLYFGIGKADKADRIEVRWPAGETQSWRDVAVNRTLLITEGREQFEERPFSGSASPGNRRSASAAAPLR